MSFLRKVIIGVLLVIATGVPILETWKALLLAAGLLALVFGDCPPTWKRLALAVALVIAVVATRNVLPRADIAEAHNPFMVIHEGEALQRGLPAEIFASWKAQFDALYPPDIEPYGPRSMWRSSGVPTMLFTQSSDAIWRKAKYTRQVDAIGFASLAEFRGGFANELQYNFWAGELRREQMPFYVMYELTPASVGSALAWKGQLFWQRSDGSYEEIIHPAVAARAIRPDDAGRRVYAAFFPMRDEQLSFAMRPSLTLRLARLLDGLLGLIGVLAVLRLTIRPRWTSYGRALSIFSIAYALMAAFLAVSAGKFLGSSYPPQGGGDDGMTHDGVGRMMAMLAGRGSVVEALKGGELVYWSTPGTRYVRMVEKLIFGDTNHLFALVVACAPIVIFYLVRHFVGARRAWAMTGIFFTLLVGNFCFLQYIYNAKLGYGEAIGGELFLLGMVLLLRTQPAWGGTDRTLPAVGVAGAALAASMFIRPNFAFAVAWLGLAYVWASLRRRDAATVIALAFGLGLACWMPFHNWYYGGEFYLISKSGATTMLVLAPRDYAAALGDLIRGRFDSHAVTATSHQIVGWLSGPGWVVKPVLTPVGWVSHYINVVALVVTCWVAFGWVCRVFRDRDDLGVVSVAAICAHLPMLFVFATQYRYAMLGWDLSLVVLIVWLLRRPTVVPVRGTAELSAV